jgi:hypothetical protein
MTELKVTVFGLMSGLRLAFPLTGFDRGLLRLVFLLTDYDSWPKQ